MYLKVLRIQRFRGFRDLTIKPKGHVVVMGPPGSGRSDLVEALVRVLDPDASRTRTTTEIDFFNKITSDPIQIEATLAELGPELEQRFLEQLELWDRDKDALVPELDTPDEIDLVKYEWVLRMQHVAKWLPDEEIAEESLTYCKNEGALSTQSPVRRVDVRELGFSRISQHDRRILDLGSRSGFRTAVDDAEGGDFAAAVSDYVKDVSVAARPMVSSTQLQRALRSVFTPVADFLRLPMVDPIGFVQFVPEGGSASGLLRSLSPTLDYGDGSGPLPVWRHGSTLMNLVRIGETLAQVKPRPVILAIDDLGDGLSSASAAHVVSQLKRTTDQLWITTRLPIVAEVFEPREVMRLGWDSGNARVARAGRRPATKADGVASKHWHRTLIPALSYRSVAVLEGPNDFTVVQTLSLRLLSERG